MGNIKIIKIEGDSGLKDFIKLPWEIYKDYPNWVPPLLFEREHFFNPSENPFFEHAEAEHYLAYENEEMVGRISAIVNHRHNSFHNDKTGFFGFFECTDDNEVSTALFDTASAFLREKGMNNMRGPCNFSTNDEIGFLAKGHDSPPTVLNTYTPEYYLKLAEDYGMTKVMDVLGYYIDDTAEIPERMLRVAERVRQREDLVVRKIRLNDLHEEVERVKQIYNKAWEKNWGFVPLTDKEIDHMAKDFKLILDPEIVFFAEIDGNPIGFSLSLPNINEILMRLNGRLFPTGILKLIYSIKIRRKIKGIRTIILGLLPEYRGKGIDNLLYLDTINNAIAQGYKWCEMGWILETNRKMRRALDVLGARIYKVYRLYDYPLK
jgi:GNAT superfamily N-acetyltransferase